MAWRALLALALLSVAGGCARSQPAAAPDPLRQLREDPRAVIRHIAKLRGLSERRPTPVVFHDAQAFAKVLEAKAEQDNVLPTVADTGAFELVFGLADERAVQPGLGTVQREQIIAFYDEVANVVHVREDPEHVSDPRKAAWTVAHEIGHSLQHQHFSVPDVARIVEEDRRLAALAMIEGDAMLVMLAYGADQEHVPLTRALVQVDESVKSGDVDRYARTSGRNQALLAAAPVVRERLEFPYLEGMSFMGSLYRAGGFELVNRVYQHPPRTTEQVLHPERYLAGEGPVPVSPPDAPAGYEMLGVGSLGELMTRIVLARCNSPADASRAAEGWGGDAFGIAKSSTDRGALLWISVWDSEQDASEFQSAVERTAACWASSPGAGARLLPGRAQVRRDGDRVAVVRGLPLALAATTSKALLGLVGKRPPSAPPHGEVTIPPVRTVPRTRPPYVMNGRVVSELLGIAMPIPPGFGVELEREQITLSRQGESPAMISVNLSEWVVSQASLAQLYAAFEQLLEASAPEEDVVPAGYSGRVSTPLGNAIERNWTVGAVSARLLVVPICQGTGAVVVAQVWGGDDAARNLTWFNGAMRPLAPVAPPVCAKLDP